VDRWLTIVTLFFIIAYLLHGYKDKHPLKFAIWSGVIMGMGMATKFNFLPILLLPFLLIDTNKNRLIYAGTGVASFFFFLLPIVNKLGNYRSFITSIATHGGLHGKGEAKMFDAVQTKNGFFQLFANGPELKFIVFAIVAAIVLAIIFRKKEKTNRELLFFSGIFLIVLFQIIMVSKHYKDTYFIPVISIYPIFLLLFHDFLGKIGKYKKWTLLPTILILSIFTGYTAYRIPLNDKYRKIESAQRKPLREYVSQNLPSNTLWFTETKWLSAPFVESGLVYGLFYSDCEMNYMQELMNKNPNIVTYAWSENIVKIWLRQPVPADSLVVTGTPIHLFSSPGRKTALLMEILENAALRNQVVLTTDTIFSHNEKQAHIIVMQNKQSEQTWKPENFIKNE
jgi:4-amino-4-deoxy-L-arabinose transferase-like glycosyltransferase